MPFTGKGGIAKNRSINLVTEHLATVSHFNMDECRSLIKLHSAFTEIGKGRVRFRYRSILKF